MNLVERIFELRKIPLFRGLGNSELVAIAEVATARRYAPGESIARGGQVLQRLYAVSEGHVEREDGIQLPQIFGVGALLAEMALPQNLMAGDCGASCIMISRGHFFRILNEFPQFTLDCIRVVEAEGCRSEGGDRS